jgi:hypothetical protein
MTRPTLYLTNVASLKTPGHKGPRDGHLTIQARPQHWAKGLGRVNVLAPLGALEPLMVEAVKERKSGIDCMYHRDRYFTAYIQHLSQNNLAPWRLGVVTDDDFGFVQDGDTLTCTCSKFVECHRRWAAPYLVKAGWRVILDGVEVTV